MELTNFELPKTIDEFKNHTGKEISQWSGAVNFLFVEDSVAFIKRSSQMPSHRGQIGFFGGHKEDSESEPLTTSLRELEEESGFSADMIDQVGIHYPVRTTRMKIIVPVISRFKGSKEDFLSGVMKNREWDNLVLAKVSALQDSGLWTSAQIIRGEEFPVYFFPLLHTFCDYKLDDPYAPYTLWGASAKMVLNFFKNPSLNAT